MILTLFVNNIQDLIEKKFSNCARALISGTYTHSKYKYEYYQKKPKKQQDSNKQIKISLLKPEIPPEIPFRNNRIIHKHVL